MPDLNIMLLIGAILLFGYVIKGFTGFGGAAFTLPVMILFMDVKFVVPFTLLSTLTSNIIIWARSRKHVDRSIIWPLIAGYLIGIVPGVFLLKNVDSEWIVRALGIVIVAYGLNSLVAGSKGLNIKVRKETSVCVGALSGLLAGSTGVGMPPTIMYLTGKLNKSVLRATAVAVFIPAGIFRFASYLFTGLYTADIFCLYIYLLPVMLLGIYIGDKMHFKVDEERFTKAMNL